MNLIRLALEEVKFLQRLRERKSGMPALPTATQAAATAGGAEASNASTGRLARKVNDKNEGDGEKDDLVLQDTFAQETAVMVEDPNMYVISCCSLFLTAFQGADADFPLNYNQF